MVPIRKGDGTGLGAKGYSQIRKGDGTVLWDAIPDAQPYYKIDEESGDVLNDANGDTNAQSTGSLVWVGDSDARHGFYVELDSNNFVEIEDSANDQLIDLNSDWTVGVTINVSSALPSEATIISYGDGSDGFALGADRSDGSEIVAGISNGNEHSVDQPSAPYQADLVVQWDGSNQTPTVFLNESEGSDATEDVQINNDDEPVTIGTNRFNDLGGEGVEAFGFWPEIVDPSRYTTQGE